MSFQAPPRDPGAGDAPSPDDDGALDALLSAYDGLYEPDFALTVGETTYRAGDGCVADLEVDTTVDGADRFSARFGGEFDPTTRRVTFPTLDWADFETGAAVTVAVGYAGALVETLVGSVSEVSADYPSSGDPSVTVAGYGPLQATTRGTATRSWDETTDADVASAVLGEYEFAGTEIESTGVTHPKVVQDAESDYDFLARRARRNGFLLTERRGVARFAPPGYDADPTVALTYGESLTSFSPTVTSAEQVTGVTVRHWDPAAKTEIEGSAEHDGPGTGTTTLRVPVGSTSEADTVARAALDRIRAGLVAGTGETVGVPDLQAGDTLRLGGLGDRFDRTYLVERATHRLGSEGFRTNFAVRERAI